MAGAGDYRYTTAAGGVFMRVCACFRFSAVVQVPFSMFSVPFYLLNVSTIYVLRNSKYVSPCVCVCVCVCFML